MLIDRRHLIRMATLMAANVVAPQAENTKPPRSRTFEDRILNEKYMRRAIELAKKSPSEPFGAVIVDDLGLIVGEGWNRVSQNPILHGEIAAINNCAERPRLVEWEKLTLFTTAEPCAMCQAAVAWTGISGVVYGSSMPFLQKLHWWVIQIRAAEIAERARFRTCAIKGGVLEEECNALFRAGLERRVGPV